MKRTRKYQPTRPRIIDRCIFCGTSPTTNEHIFPHWMRHYLKKTHKKWNTDVFREGPEGPFIGRQKHHGDPIDHQVKCVCERRCNNGWMKQFEDSTKPILVPLIRGQPIQLSKIDQATLATWVAIKCTVLEYDTGGSAISTLRQRQSLMTRQKPPPTWRIWIGHYTDAHWRPSFANHTFALGFDADVYATKLNAQTLTYLCGQVLIHLMRLPREVDSGLWNFPKEIQQKLIRVWPSRSIANWPPPALTAVEAFTVATGFFDLMNSSRVKQRPPWAPR